MSDWKKKVILNEGQVLRKTGSSSKGFMLEIDVDSYDILNQDGTNAGSVTVEDHTAVKNFRRTISIDQKGATGKTIHSESWTV